MCTQLLRAPAHTDAEVMLNVFVNSLLQRVAGTTDAGVLEAIREDASVQEVLSRPSSIRTVEDIHGNTTIEKQPNVTEVLLAVNKANETAGRGATNLPDFGQATSSFSAYDVEDWAELPWYAKDWRIGRRLVEKGFCILKGSLSSDIRHEAVKEAMELRKTGGFKRLPYEVLAGFFGEMGSAWTRELHGDPMEQALQQVEKHIVQLGTDLAHCSVAFSGLRLHGHMAGTVHISRTFEDTQNPALTDPEVANYYLSLFMRKKLKLFCFLGPSPAMLAICPLLAEDESQVYRTQLQPGSMVVVRGEACSCSLNPQLSEPCVLVEVDFFPEMKHAPFESASDRVPPPPELQSWLLGRLKAIADNDVQENVPEEWIKLARQTFMRSRPMKILEISHQLPCGVGAETSKWEGTALGGFDCISEIPKSKWDLDAYFDPDPGSRDDFKMYTRHMGVLESFGSMSFEELSAFGLSQDDPRQSLLLHSVQDCLGKSGLSKQELRGQNLGFFCGLSGNEMYHELMTGDVKSLGRAAQGLLSNAGYVNRIAWFYGTKGPSICIDTEESSGAAAMDTALNYGRETRCSKAVVCSMQLIQHPVTLIVCCAMGQLSATGRGQAFDESADGVVRSEGSVALFLETFARRKVEEIGFDFAEDLWEEELQEEDLTNTRIIVAGSALNSRGQSSSLTTPSGPAMQDLIHSALKDAKSPACIVDAIEVSAGGNSLMDAVELGVLRKTLQSERSKVLCSFKSVIGETGPPSGLAAMVRACLMVEKALHGPHLHFRQLSIFAGEVDEDGNRSPQLATEVVPSASMQQTLGISSFGNSGTNVQLVLMGSGPQPQDNWQTGKELYWFPSSAAESKETSYFIIGSFNSWEEPVKMEVESKGVYAFTMVLGENRWETFQIWENGDPDKVLHPGSHWADRDQQVLGPSRQGVCGRFSTWRISGKPTKLRLLNEEQARDLDICLCAEELLSYSGDIELRVLTAFPGDYTPDGEEYPVVDQDSQLLGMPGDRYRVWLRLGGKYRCVEWQKLPSAVPQALPLSSYYVAGDFNFWDFQPMEEEEAAASKTRRLFTEVKLRSSDDVFQVVRNKDWDQAFYPEAETQNLRGPDGYGVAKGWCLPGKAGDVFRIHFQRSLPSSGEDKKSVSWTLQPKSSSPSQELALPKSYCIVGSWSNFVSRDPMRFDEAKSSWTAEVEVGTSGIEFFQILLDGCWLAAVYPNSHEADFRKTGHAVLGPDSRGGSSYWRIQDGLEAGDRVEVVLEAEVDAMAMPKAIRWHKAS